MREEDCGSAVDEWGRPELDCAEELTALEGLDLSHLDTREGIAPLMIRLNPENDVATPRWKYIGEILRTSVPRGLNETSEEDQLAPNGIAKAKARQRSKAPAVQRILPRLKWLGLCNEESPLQSDGTRKPDVFNHLLPACENLTTLSLRASNGYEASYWDSLPICEEEAVHQALCRPILRITENAPDSIRTLELRHYIDYLPPFMLSLRKMRSKINRVGIDFGAWV